jgi:hypothetical protein
MTKIRSFEDFVASVGAHLTRDELATGVAYAALPGKPFARGTRLQFPGTVIRVPAESSLAFIDRQPMANWGHPARYLLVGHENGKTWSFETRLPPFQPGGNLRWRLIYKAPSVPDGAAEPTR